MPRILNRGGRPRENELTPFGLHVVDLAKRRGMTVRDLADAAGLSHPTVYRILSGVTPDPRASTLLALANALGTTMQRLWVLPTATHRRQPA